MNKYRGTILLDMDDVLAEFLPSWLSVYNEAYDDKLSVTNLTRWKTSDFVKPECGEKIYDLLKNPGLFRYLEPTQYSQEVVRRLVENEFEVVIVSDAPAGHSHCEYKPGEKTFGNPTADKKKWLYEYFPEIPSENVIITSQKWRIDGDVLVDDKPSTFELFQEKGKDIILIDMPYNRHIQTNKRAMNILEAEEMIYKKFKIK